MLNSVLLIGVVPQAQGGGPVMSLMPLALIFFIFYFLLIRPQQKQRKAHEEMVSNLKKGDQVVTTGGIYGMVVAVKEKTLTLKVADNVKIELQKSAVGHLKKVEEPSEQK